MRPKRITVIIPTWNSMPELQDAYNALKDAFGKYLYDIIIVDKHSKDKTVLFAYKHKCKLIWDDGTLGSARLSGMKAAKTKWIAWIDSDIVLPVGWYKTMCKYLKPKVGWIYGITKEDIPFLEKAHEWKRQLRNNLPRKLKMGEFERAYTNNTICLRRPLLDAPIKDLNAWEDYVMGQHMIKKGYDVIEVPVFCDHLKHGVYEKFGNYTEAWGVAGELKAKGFNPYTLMRPFYFAIWGIRCTIHFKDFKYFQYYFGVFTSMIKAIFKYRNKCFGWSRE